jgi:speckle-type POZ protein
MDNVIDLNEEDTFMAQSMLSFLYGFNYDSSGNDQTVFSPMVFSVKVYTIAENYDIHALKSQAKGKFEEAVRTCWGLDDFPHAIAELYNFTPSHDRGVRDFVVETRCQHINALLEKQAFADILERSASFAADITRLMATKRMATPGLEKYMCPSRDEKREAILPSISSCYCIRCGHSRSDWKAYVLE